MNTPRSRMTTKSSSRNWGTRCPNQLNKFDPTVRVAIPGDIHNCADTTGIYTGPKSSLLHINRVPV